MKQLWIVGCWVGLWVGVACSGKGAPESVVQSTMEGTPLLVDVRTLAEFRRQHVPGALHIPLAELAGRLEELRGETRTIGLYCRSGQRSEKARKLLEKEGFEKGMACGVAFYHKERDIRFAGWRRI